MNMAANSSRDPRLTCSNDDATRELFARFIDDDQTVVRERIDNFIDAVGDDDRDLDLHFVYAAAAVLPVDDFEYFVCMASSAPILDGTALFQMVDSFWDRSCDLPRETWVAVMRLAGYTGNCGDEDRPGEPVVIARSSQDTTEAWTAHSVEVPGADLHRDHLVAVVEPKRLLAQRDTKGGRRYFVDEVGLAVLEVCGRTDPR